MTEPGRTPFRRVPPALQALAALFTAALLMVACGGGSAKPGAPAAAAPPTIISHPADQSLLQGQTASFQVVASSGTPMAYLWSRNGTSIPGATAATFTTASTTLADSGATFTVAITNATGTATSRPATLTVTTPGTVRIIYLHHSTGGYVWGAGVPETFAAYNAARGTAYDITAMDYPSTNGGYPWANYPYDYYDLWVKHTGTNQEMGELTLDQIATDYDVIMFKHCFPVSEMQADTSNPNIDSDIRSLENYKLQYAALKARMHAFPNKKFIVWTGAVEQRCSTFDETTGEPQRARAFWDWVRTTWDEPGDNIFVWDFAQLETEGNFYNQYPMAPDDNHPSDLVCQMAAPHIALRIIDVIEGRGEQADLTARKAGTSAPTISAFTATPTGGGATLAWTSTGATRLAVDHQVGIVTGASAMAHFAGTVTFTLTAMNATGSTSRTVQVTAGN